MTKRELLIFIILNVILNFLFSTVFQGKPSPDATSYDRTASVFATEGKFVEPVFALDEKNDVVMRDKPFSDGGLGYPIFLGTIYKIFGVDGSGREAGMIIQAIILGVSVPLSIYLFLSLLNVGLFWARLALLATLLWPTGVILSMDLLTESLSTSCLSIFMVSSALFIMRPRNQNSFNFFIFLLSAVGLFLLRYEFAPVILLVFSGIACLNYHRAPENMKLTIVAGIFLGLVFIFPGIRNYLIFDRYVPLSTTGGKVLWLAAECKGSFEFYGKSKDTFVKAYVQGDYLKTDDNLRDIAVTEVKRDPVKYIKCSVGRVINTIFVAHEEFSWSQGSTLEKIIKIYQRLFKVVIVLGYVFGIFILIRENLYAVAGMLGGIFFFKFLIIHALLNGGPRFATVIEPMAIALTCYVLDRKSKNDISGKLQFP
ncbi:MAG: hypothetical protein A4S09_00310 [Proteobacteria bacterium SG_bin7]|nr:MAG: hypothetical protein A4S09_00310 [Proteobacteria bacterium SG_bin7]